jgi:TatD DNase family protein
MFWPLPPGGGVGERFFSYFCTLIPNPMQLIDTHTHLYLPEFDDDRDTVVENAVSSGVGKLLMPNINNKSVDLMIAAEKGYPGVCYSMIGLHPTSVKDDYRKQMEEIETVMDKHRFIAIGEIGIDLYWDKTYIKEQIEVFRHQLNIALARNMAVAIHSREAFAEIFSVLEEFGGKGLKGVFHAFTGDLQTARRATEMGYMLGIGGVVTFKNSGLAAVIKEIGPEHLVLETDSPYLAPVPHRGKRNESSYICIINRKLAEIFDCGVEEIAEITTSNAKDLFKI